MKAFEIIKIGSNLLKEKEIPSFILDSEILLSKTLKKSREEILTNLNQKVHPNEISTFKKYLPCWYGIMPLKPANRILQLLIMLLAVSKTASQVKAVPEELSA